MVRASSRSNASAPRPSHSGRYVPANGITASLREIGAKRSATEVMMCSPRKTTTSSEALRCSRSTTNRGHPSARQRRTSTMPSATLIVSSNRLTAPVPRLRYHMALPLALAAAITRAPPRGASRRRGRPGRHARPAGRADACAPATRAQPPRGRPQRCSRCSRRRRAAATLIHPPRLGRRLTGTRVEMMQLPARPGPAPRRRAGGQSAGGDADRLPGASKPPAWSSVTRTGHPPAGAAPPRDVAAEVDRRSACHAPGDGGRPVRAQGLRGGPEVELDPRRDPDGDRRRLDLHRLPCGGGHEPDPARRKAASRRDGRGRPASRSERPIVGSTAPAVSRAALSPASTPPGRAGRLRPTARGPG